MNRLLRFGAVLPLLIVVGAPVRANAQLNFNVAAGLSLATGDFGDAHDAGYVLLAGLGPKPNTSPISFRAEGIYTEYNLKSISGKTRIIGATGNATYDFSMGPGNLMTPYAIGGLGYYSTRVSLGGSSASDSNVGWNIGGGVRFPLSGFTAYGEVRYHKVGNDGGSFVPIVFGISF